MGVRRQQFALSFFVCLQFYHLFKLFRCTYTTPRVAHVGIKGIRTHAELMMSWYSNYFPIAGLNKDVKNTDVTQLSVKILAWCPLNGTPDEQSNIKCFISTILWPFFWLKIKSHSKPALQPKLYPKRPDRKFHKFMESKSVDERSQGRQNELVDWIGGYFFWKIFGQGLRTQYFFETPNMASSCFLNSVRFNCVSFWLWICLAFICWSQQFRKG